jgi:hypothetical protein
MLAAKFWACRPSLACLQCFAESVRGKTDWVNGSLAGGAAGLALGLRRESPDAPLRLRVQPHLLLLLANRIAVVMTAVGGLMLLW